MSSFNFYIWSIILLCYNVDSANILGLFPHTGKSHHMVIEPFLRRLAERGHNLTVASFFPMQDPPPNVHDISFQGIYELRLESIDLNEFENENILYKVPIIGSVAKQILPVKPFATAAVKICERLIDFQPLTDALKGDYDLVLVENFMSDCVLGLHYVYRMKAPLLGLVSGSRMPWTMARLGAVDNPSYVPTITTSFTSHMSFMERLENTLTSIAFHEWHHREILMKEREILEKKFGNIPDLRDLGRNTSMIFMNTFHVFSGAMPLVPGLVEVGGMHLSSKLKPIPQYIERFLNESEHGVVLFSFGSHLRTSTLPKYKEQIFINALSKLKQRVVWKYEGSDAEGTQFGNILRVKWLPQYELIQHKKVVAFISHGGMLGMTEAVSAGKPTVVVPFFADQHLNAAAAAEAGFATVLSYADLTEASLTRALQAVLRKETVAKARQVSQMWHDRQSLPLDTAVFYAERTIRWGHNAKLYSKGRDLPIYQLALIDVAVTILVAIVVLLALITYLIVKVLNLLTKVKRLKVKVN
ncbi:UDP-glycosyltransferase UGT5-like [Maniola hyperantus]|uniref:UDP-glycosyltransferase UGT5-like n=1 Tax=Aphantopus hyperantus TaxID=2795564 RepID=UPI00156A0507|nr:UDP-glucuronosyltransferase 2B15-like [Maniola hyperantus]